MLFSTFFTSIQPPWPLVPSSLMLARWELGLLMAWNIFFICTTVFIMGTDKISPLPKTPDWILLQYYCAPNSPFSVPLPPAAPAVGTVTTGPWMYLRILSSVSVGLLHFSSLDQWVGVSHLHVRSKASNSICDTGDQPHGLGVPPPRLVVSVCKRAYISYSNLKLRQKRHRSLAETHTTVILASV